VAFQASELDKAGQFAQGASRASGSDGVVRRQRGCRDSEICNLQREWKVKVPELVTSASSIPGKHVKNGDQQARKRAGIPDVRVHDLKHTFGRLRTAGVSFEDRQDLLGHRSGRFGAQPAGG